MPAVVGDQTVEAANPRLKANMSNFLSLLFSLAEIELFDPLAACHTTRASQVEGELWSFRFQTAEEVSKHFGFIDKF